MHLNPLTFRTIGRLAFTCETGIHVGAGGEGLYKTPLKIGDMLLIPATTWKGAFRALSERIIKSMRLDGVQSTLRELYYEDGGEYFRIDGEVLKEHVNALREYLARRYGGVMSALRQLAAGNGELLREIEGLRDGESMCKYLFGRGRALLQRYLAMLYPITSLYGSQGVAGKVRFLDTPAKAYSYFKPGVGIDRKTMTAAEGRLYIIEILIPRDGSITLRILVDNVERGTLEARVLAATLRYVESEGLEVGGSRSRGIGHLELQADKSYFRVLNLSEKTDLPTMLKQLASPASWKTYSLKQFIRDVLAG
ncbi:MAG: RAMP superfamily CRISPR-associated protein [Nitrososphaerota archaeon]